jgi:hypothetical protein
MTHDFWVIVHGDRESLFRSVFGDNRVPIESPVGEWMTLPDMGGPQYAYKLALKAITPDQRRKIVAHIAQRFGYPEQEVDHDLETEGMPILARDASVVVYNPQRWLDDDGLIGDGVNDRGSPTWLPGHPPDGAWIDPDREEG